MGAGRKTQPQVLISHKCNATKSLPPDACIRLAEKSGALQNGTAWESLWPAGPVSRGCFCPSSDQVARPRSAAGEAVFPRVQVSPGDSDAGATAARATPCLLLALKGRQCLFLKYRSIFKNALLRGLFPGLSPSYLSKGDDISSFWRSHSNLDKDKLTLRRIF